MTQELRERAGYPAPPDIAERREMIFAAMAPAAALIQPPPTPDTLNGVRVLRFNPEGAKRGRVQHHHGGGFRIGSPEQVAPYAAALAERCGVEVVCPAYGLAPERPFPGGVLDALSVYAALKREGDTPIIISGDSAGGGIAAAAAAKLVADGAPPAGVALLSPWLDVTCEADSYARNGATDPLFSLESATLAAEFYLQGWDPRDALASPLFADVTGFPPTFLSVGGREVLTDDTRSFRKRLDAAGIDVIFLEIDQMDHVAVTRGLDLPGSPETFGALAGFVTRVIAAAR